MSRTRFVAAACLVAALVAASAATATDAPQAQESAASGADVAEMTARVDREIAAVWERDGVEPAEPSTDEEFARRVYLDVVGQPPSRDELLAFLSDEEPDRRARLIDRLLNDPRFGEHLADRWTVLLVGRNPELQELGLAAADVFAVWLAEQFNADRSFYAVIRDMVAAAGPISENPASAWIGLMGIPPRAANMAGRAAQFFGGVRIQCAQCHDHPYDKTWTQEAFRGMAAFFKGVEWRADFYRIPPDPSVQDSPIPPREMLEAWLKNSPDFDAQRRIKELLDLPQPRLPGDKPVRTTNTALWRGLFADWLASPENRTAQQYQVNRFWSFLFGQPLMDPVDDFHSLNEASHPALLEALAEDWTAHGAGVKRLYRILLNTRTYQLSSRIRPGADHGQPWHFARAQVRQLTPEQFFASLFGLADGDSLVRSFARREVNQLVQLRRFADLSDDPDSEEAKRFDREVLERYEQRLEGMSERWRLRRGLAVKYARTAEDDERSETDAFTMSIDQALSVMNGDAVRRLGGVRNGTLMFAIFRDLKTQDERIEALWLSVLSRRPTDREIVLARELLGEEDSAKPNTAAWENLFYALVAGTEFSTNH